MEFESRFDRNPAIPVSAGGDRVVAGWANIAARIVDLAGPGEILLSAAALDGCGGIDSIAVSPVGPTSVKGVAEPVWLHRVEVGVSA